MELTEPLRQTFLLVVSILALICFFSSFMLFICAAYIKIKVDTRMKLIETYNSNVLPAIFLFVGVINLAQNVTCLFVCLKMRMIENREGLMRMLLPVLIGGIVLVVFEVSTAIASFVHISILEDEFETGLKKAMTEYVIGKELKVEMDTVQAEYGCCGDLDYTNWFEYSWLDPQFLKASTRGAKKYFQTDGKYYSDDTPYSCCDVHSPRPCIHHHVNDNSKHHNYNYEVETTLYVRGCRIVLMELYSRVLCTVAVIALLIATVKTSALLMFRLLQTSFLLAQEAGDWEATTPAYIYYLQPPDTDLEQKKLLEGTTSASSPSPSNTESSTENPTDENTNNDTEYDDDDAAAGAAYQSNSNYSHQNYTGGGENISDDTPEWQPLSLPPLIPGTGYLQDENVRLLSNTDDMALQNRWGKQPVAFQSGSFVVDNHNDSYTQGHVGIDNISACGESSYTTVPSSETDPYKMWAERNMYGSGQRLYPAQQMSEVVSSGIPSDSRNMSVSSDKCLMNSEQAGKQGMLESQKPRLRDDHQGFAGRLLNRLTSSLKPQKKYRDSSNSYKYSLVRTNSDSDEQEEEEVGEEDEEGEEENEAEEEEEEEMCSSEEEDDSNKNKTKKGYTLLCGTRDTDEESGNVINKDKYNRSKLEDIKNNVSYHVQRRKSETGIVEGNESYTTTDNMIYSHSYYPRHLKDSPCGSDVSVTKSRDAASSSSRVSMSSYHEVNEMSGDYKLKQPKQRKCDPRLETDSGFVEKNNVHTRDSRSGEEIVSKSVSFPSTIKPVDDLNINSQIHSGLHTSTGNKRMDVRNHGQTLTPLQGYNPSTGWSNPNNSISTTSYTEQTDTHISTADQVRHSVHWPKQNRLAELAGTTESSETDYEAASNGSGEDIDSHRRKFIGRYTPYPYEIIRHTTTKSEEYGLMSTNTRQCREITSKNAVNQLPRERNDAAEVSSTDAPESDNEMSNLITAASTSKLHFKRNQQNESKQLSLSQALSKFKFEPAKSQSQFKDEKIGKSARVPLVNGGFSTGQCGEENYENVNISETYSEHADPKMDVAMELKSGAKPFAFPLMQPSPSSFEMSSSVRNHIRSYQRRSVFLASPISHSRENSPMHFSSPHRTLFSSPLQDSPMETSTPILYRKRMWDSFKCQTLSAQERDHSSIQLSHQMEVTPRCDPGNTSDTPKYGDDANTRQTSFPTLFPSMSGIEKQSLGAPNQLLAVEGTLLIDEVYTSSEVCDVVHNVTTTEQSSSKGRVLISPFN